MTLEDDYGMIDGIINNGRRGEELEKAQAEARRTTPEKKPSIRELLEDAKRECAERECAERKERTSPPRRRSPRSWATYEPEQEMASGMGVLPGRERQAPVQQALQGLYPSLQTGFPGGGVVLSALSFPPF